MSNKTAGDEAEMESGESKAGRAVCPGVAVPVCNDAVRLVQQPAPSHLANCAAGTAPLPRAGDLARFDTLLPVDRAARRRDAVRCGGAGAVRRPLRAHAEMRDGRCTEGAAFGPLQKHPR